VDAERSRVAAAVYGTILVLAVVSYLSEDDALGPGRVAIAMLGTAVVYFAAHVYVDYLAARTTGESVGHGRLLRRVVAEEWPLLEATLVPGIPLVLGAAGVLSRSTSLDMSLIVALVDLTGWGYAAGRRSYDSTAAAVASALVATTLGLVVVALKSLLH
jgi:alkylation response protein AidB-like acyl-CoA dehydrogenase